MPGERQPKYVNDFNKADPLQVLLALQGKVNRELHVATLCIVESKLQDRVFRCSAFPKAEGKDAAMFNAICIRGFDADALTHALDDNKKMICVAIMTDLLSQPNYDSIIAKGAYEAIEDASQLHSYNNAVIVHVGDAVDGTRIEMYWPKTWPGEYEEGE